MLAHYIASGLINAHGASGYFFLKHTNFSKLIKERSRVDYIGEIFGICNEDIIIMPKQEHTNKVLVFSSKDANRPSSDIPADSVVTDVPGTIIGVRTADCVPVLLYDQKSKISGAAHAGWRGALSGILENTVFAMMSLGSETKNIVACLGPAVRQYSYEVSGDLYSSFIEKSLQNRTFFKNKGEKYLFDLPGYCRSVLDEMGVETEDIGIDTYTNSEILYSYRKINSEKQLVSSGFGQFSLIRFI